MQFTSLLENYNTALWTFHIKVPTDIANHFFENGTRRVICRLNDQLEFQCAVMPNGKDEFFILLNKKIRDTLKLKLGSEITAVLRKDDSEYGLPVSEEFRELLLADPEGSEIFHHLTPGKQRTLLHIINTVKSSDLRITKGLVILDHLKSTNGEINYKQLNEAFKNNPYR